MECSSKTGEGVMEVFESATRLALLDDKKSDLLKAKKSRSFRRLFGRTSK
jgi:hypothetical protein